MKCLILAGGFATRLYPITINRPKALLEFKGEPAVNHLIRQLPSDIDILLSTNSKFEADFRDWQKTLARPVDIGIEVAASDKEKKGAVGAIDFWIKERDITDDLIVAAANNYFEIDMRDFVARYNRRNAMIAAYDVGNAEKACQIGKACQVGLVVVEGDRIVRFDEKPDEATSSIVATGLYVLPPRVFPILSEYCKEHRRDNMGSFIAYLVQREDVHAYVFRTVWLDIGDEILRGRLSV